MMAAMQQALGEDLLQRITVDIDDIFIYDTIDHLQLLDKVLDRLERAGVIVNIRKCKFLLPIGKFLRFVVTHEGPRIRMGDPKLSLPTY